MDTRAANLTRINFVCVFGEFIALRSHNDRAAPQKIVTNMEKSTDHDGLQGSLPSPEAPAENSALGALSRSGCT